MHKAILCLCFLMLLFGCKKKEEPTAQASLSEPQGELVVYALDVFRSSGLESTVVPDFIKQNNCTVQLKLFHDIKELSNAVRTTQDSVDIVLGIDAGFAVSDSLFDYFQEQDKEDFVAISSDIVFDYSYRLIPYGFSYMSMLYNQKLLDKAPISFGELQDSKYYNQLAVCNPHTSGVGRSTLLWSLALFGTDGYEHMLKSLRKNVYRNYSDSKSAIDALLKGECKLMLGLSTTSAWLMETDPDKKYIKTSMFKEGSYQYCEALGIHVNSKNPSLGKKFITYFVSPPTQKMIVYKYGLFPANGNTILPGTFSTLPLNTWSTNSRLSPTNIQAGINEWLMYWDRLFSYY